MLTRILFALALVISCAGAKCATNSAGPGGTVTDGGVVAYDGGFSFSYCTDQNVENVANGIQGDVASALATANYVADIAKLIGKFTIGEVKCAIQIFIGGNGRKASADALVAAEISRGQAYLQANP